MAATATATATALPLDTILQGDCLELLRTLPDASVDAVVTDPPYGTTACKWDTVIPFAEMWRQLRRVTRSGSSIILFSSQPFTSALVMSNPRHFRHEWIWQKSHGGGFLNASRAPLKRHESILVFSDRAPRYVPQMSAGKAYRCRSAAAGATTQDQSVAGWWTINPGERYPTSVLTFTSETGLHPTQKPVDLLRYLIRTYTAPADVVLDFTCGSGTTCLAAQLEGRHYLGMEREQEYVAIARARLAGERPPVKPKPSKRARATRTLPTLWEASAIA